LLACGSSPSSSSSKATLNAEAQKLVAAAKGEGTLLLQEPFLGGEAHAKDWEKDFNSRYGLNITIKYQEGGNIPQNVATLTAAYQAGHPANTDAFVGSQTHILSLDTVGALAKIDLAAASNIDSKWVQGDGTAVPFYTRIPGIAYNTNNVTGSAIPTSYQDLLTSTAKIATTPYGSSFADLASSELWGGDKTITYVKAFAKKVKGLIGCGDEQMIASGQYDMMAPDCAENIITELKAKGAPIAYVIPKDAPEIPWFWASVPKNGPHPNVAQLFTDYLLSPSAQAILYKYDYSDLNLIANSHTSKDIAKLQSQGIKIYIVDVNFAVRDGAANEQAIRKQVNGILAALAQ
jgi:ABC-type Fe3+ transport system substrate-binding protein